jgi:DNA repair exonuclease SbcCD ATPase subunit
MRFLLGMLLAVRGIERVGSRRLPQLWGSGPKVAEKVDGQHEALAMIAGEFRRLREEKQALRRRQAESLEVAAGALTRLADGQALERPAGAPHETDALRTELEEQRARLEARDVELQQLRAANTRLTEDLHELRTAHGEAHAAHRRTEEQLQSLRETHRDTEEQLETLREAHRHTEEQLAEAEEKRDKSTRRLASSQRKLRRLHDDLEIARMPWWRRRRAQADRW